MQRFDSEAMDNVAVKITVSVEYALQALLEVASESSGERALSASEISTNQAIPGKFLEAILRKLTQAGLLISSRGPHGGYKLAKPADEITVAEVIRVIEGPLAAVGDRAPEATRYRRSAKNLTKVWIATRVALRDSLENMTVADIIEDEFPSGIKQALRRKDAWTRRGK